MYIRKLNPRMIHISLHTSRDRSLSRLFSSFKLHKSKKGGWLDAFAGLCIPDGDSHMAGVGRLLKKRCVMSSSPLLYSTKPVVHISMVVSSHFSLISFLTQQGNALHQFMIMGKGGHTCTHACFFDLEAIFHFHLVFSLQSRSTLGQIFKKYEAVLVSSSLFILIQYRASP